MIHTCEPMPKFWPHWVSALVFLKLKNP